MSYRRINRAEYNIVRFLMLINIWWIGCIAYNNPLKSLKIVYRLINNFKLMMGKNKLVRAFKTNGRYVWDIYNPAWPSKAFNSFFVNLLHEIESISDEHITIRRLFIAITKRCPLKCEHCSEGATLYNQDVLSYNELVSKIDPFVQKNVGQLVYSGGEPLSRFKDLIKLITQYKNRCDQWIYTSAFGLTIEKARLLKEAGLNGAAISLDHHIEEEHNQFRGNQKSYYWVIEGIKNLQEVGIFVAINICPTKEYIDSNSLEDFISLAQELGIPIVNILEPRAVGNYQDKDVELEMKHKEYLEEVSKKYNFNPTLFDSPTVIYPAAYRKMMPCGGGKSYLLLDYDGNLYPCPFCKVKMTSSSSNTTLCEAN